jgi:CheY-like chemotaxis protein
LLHELARMIRDTFPKGVRVQEDTPPDLWPVLGSATQVHQVLLNLCVNARDAMPAGGTLTLSAENTHLDEQYVSMHPGIQPGRYVLVTVADTGCGIPEALRERIFEPFFTTKPEGEGTGLGLPTALSIIKDHLGHIHLYSELNKGSIFKVYLPAAPGALPDASTEHSVLPRGHGEWILIVDDEASILSITQQTLETFGYRVLKAANGADAIALYAQHRRDVALVMTDMLMPIMDGPATIHALMQINPRVKIIGASGLHANGHVAKAAGAGVRHFLPKPYTAATMLRLIDEVLRGEPEA